MNSQEKSLLKICIAIPTYNRESVLIDTIEQVLSQNPLADEVLVVDQTEQHEAETEAYLTNAEKCGQIRWIKQSPPNLPAARCRAINETRCDVIIFIDDDVEMPSSFVESHKKNYFDGKVVGVAGRVIQEGSSAITRKEWPPIMDHRYFPLDSMERKEDVVNFRGCNHSVRVSALTHIGGYDTNYIGWAYREDSDVAIRLWKAGGIIVFDPDSWLRHLAIPTGGCRLKANNNKRLPEWMVSFPATYFAFCHLFPNKWFWTDLFIVNIRKYILRRENVCQPWRLPWAVISYIYAIVRALSLSVGISCKNRNNKCL